jgi:branched-chain amino acid transport system ATP-binding protein
MQGNSSLQQATSEPALLQVTNLKKSFGGVHAVDGVSFDLAPGQMLALIGPNGAGKSTCFNLINGQLTPDSGEVLLSGSSIKGLAPRAIWRKGVGRTFQVASTYSSMTVVENVQVALMSSNRKLFDFFGSAARAYRSEAIALLEQVGLKSEADEPCSTLAYGEIKTVELAIALANNPKLLLMDEPTAGMAPKERNALMALTQRIAKERQLGVLFTEHSMDVVFAYASKIMVLARGQLVASGNPAEIKDDAKVREVYFGSGRLVKTMTEKAMTDKAAS